MRRNFLYLRTKQYETSSVSRIQTRLLVCFGNIGNRHAFSLLKRLPNLNRVACFIFQQVVHWYKVTVPVPACKFLRMASSELHQTKRKIQLAQDDRILVSISHWSYTRFDGRRKQHGLMKRISATTLEGTPPPKF